MKHFKTLTHAFSVATLIGFGVFSNSASADQQILDDLIVDGSACIGQDCNNGESFGFDTIRIKENNLRIKAQDTSSTASFPSSDWQLTFNDSTNGGQNKFSIDDISGGRTPLTIEANAPSHSIYVDDGGRLGLGTNAPVVDVHVKTGNTPTMRLEQDGSSGFTPQTWDVASNETNFFIRDATNGSKLPFRIRPGAPTSSIDISPAGNVGFGVSGSLLAADLHVKRGNADMIIEDTTAAASGVLLTLNKMGSPAFRLTDSSQSLSWDLSTRATEEFVISKAGSGGFELVVEADGDLLARGDVYAKSVLLTSSRAAKTDIIPIKASEVMEKLKQVEVAEWRYKTSEKHDRHISPMAEDFYSLFKFGPSNKHINPNDLASVAIIAAKELQKKSEALEAENVTLKKELVEQGKMLNAKNEKLQQRLSSLEKLVTNLAAGQGILPDNGDKVAIK